MNNRWSLLRQALGREIRTMQCAMVRMRKAECGRYDLSVSYIAALVRLRAQFDLWLASGARPDPDKQHWADYVPRKIKAAFWEADAAFPQPSGKGRPRKALFSTAPVLPKGARLQRRLRKQWIIDDARCRAGLVEDSTSEYGLALRRALDMAQPRLATATGKAKTWTYLLTDAEWTDYVRMPKTSTAPAEYTLEHYRYAYKPQQAERKLGGRPRTVNPIQPRDERDL